MDKKKVIWLKLKKQEVVENMKYTSRNNKIETYETF